MQHGRKSSSPAFNGVKEPCALDWDSTVTREGVVCPANAPELEAVEWLAETLGPGLGLLQLDLALGYRASLCLPAPGPQAGTSAPQTTSPWTSCRGRSPVRRERAGR